MAETQILAIGADKDFAPAIKVMPVAKMEISPDNPAVTASPVFSTMAAITADHLDEVVTNLPKPIGQGQPVYFCWTTGGIRLHPPSDKPYWLKITYRDPIKSGAAPNPND